MAVGTGVMIAKAAIAVAGSDKGRKMIIGGLLALILPFVLIIVLFLGLIKSFLPDGTVSSDMDVTQTAIYQSVSKVTTPFYTELREQMDKEKANLIQENTVVEKQINDAGDEVSVKKCSITVTQEINYIGAGYLIAYLTYTDGLDEKTAKIDEIAAKVFLETICQIKTEQTAEGEYTIRNDFLDPEEIERLYFGEDEAKKTEYQAACNAYAEFFQTSETEITTEEIDIHDIGHVSLLEIPLYLQYQEPWGKSAYGNGTISQKGCAPTCLAMVLSYLKQEEIIPTTITAWTGNTYYVSGQGSSWDIFPAVSGHWGVTCTNLGKSQDAMINAVSAGKPVIASMGPGTFTKGGHFIVLSGITENGGIKVNDPNDSATKKHKEKEFDVSLVMRESKNFWSFEVIN